ncbi:lysylphosphatidylglycerol synthase domain-containing protein [Actinotalea sp. K2]|uniref:lysylphosphatidylglycerol synthase domain-containing protein n=1 Tax=Actinotalea sp. K2 TaxID=2939438 RepID=UPI002017D41E|nr:lysylphosphatidylglycerol synthase domain-containing protein [Actinotalea sp. K2]MCL3862709.1 lysylphosphatidylglycerol synthase domain-containing protein [Actinotalea sp. K2]
MTRKRLLRLGATIVVLGLVGYFFARSLAANWDAVREIEIEINCYSVAAVVLFAVAVLVSGLLWGSMLSHLGRLRVPVTDAIRVQCASWLLKYVPGQVGSVANKVMWAHQRGISRTLVVITFVYENVFLLLGSVVPTVVILLVHDAVSGTAGASSTALGSLIPVLLALVPLLLVTDRRLFRWAVNLVARRALKRDVPHEYFLGSLPAIGYQLMFLVPRLINGLGFVLIVASFLDVPESSYVPLAAIYVLAGAIGILAVFVPSGLGVRESVIVLLASRYMPVEQAIVLSLLARLYSTVGDILVALVYGGLKIREVKEGRPS